MQKEALNPNLATMFAEVDALQYRFDSIEVPKNDEMYRNQFREVNGMFDDLRDGLSELINIDIVRRAEKKNEAPDIAGFLRRCIEEGKFRNAETELEAHKLLSIVG